MTDSARAGQDFRGVRLTRGGFDLIQLAMRSEEFTDVVPPVPTSLPQAKRPQRGYMEAHMRGIAQYIAWNNNKWGFGPISLAIHPDRIVWTPISDDPSGSSQYGTLTIRMGSRDSIKILDGQHRRAALSRLITGPAKGIPNVNQQLLAAAQKSIRASSLSIDLYLIDNDQDAGQLFSDMAKAKAITLSERATLDQRDPFNAATAAIMENDRIPESLRWLTPLIAPTVRADGLPGPRSLAGKRVSYWLMPHDVAKILKWRLLPAGRATAKMKKRTPKTQVIKAASTLFNEELPALRDEWAEIKRVNPTLLPELRKTSWAWMPGILMIAAASLHTYTTNAHDDSPLREWWGKQRLDRADITGDHPLFRENDRGFVVMLAPHVGRESALYLLSQLP